MWSRADSPVNLRIVMKVGPEVPSPSAEMRSMAPIKSCAVLILSSLLIGGPARAQTIPSVIPNGADTAVTSVDGTHEITGGTVSNDGENLFHSFEQFGLDTAETANFIVQPDVLNVIGRINGGRPSVINGQLQLSGGEANLFLLNPVGVFFGPEATLALPGDLSISTADGLAFADQTFDVVGTADYANLVGSPTGLLFRSSQSGSVVNTADLTLGADRSLTLAGGTVVSTGTASAGSVAIASIADQQLVRLSPDGAILSYEIIPDDSASGLSPLTLPALLTGAGNIANSLQLDADGTVRLVNADLTVPDTPGTTIVNGTVTASDIILLGDTVGVVSSVLDASGGGTIRIGGSYQGNGPLPNAQLTYVDADSVVNASATELGDGGEIIVWSDGTTHALGQFLVRGGTAGGNGGLVETSGLRGLTLGDSPDISAPLGTAGEWLIDPFDIVISNAGGDNGFDPANPFVAIASPAQLNVSTLVEALGAGGTVRVTTGSEGTETGNITLDSNLLFFIDGEAELSLEAAGSIFINREIRPNDSSGPLNINLLADTDNTGNGQVVFDNQNAEPNAIIDTAGGNLTVVANSTTLTGVADTSAIILAANDDITTEGDIGFPGAAGDGSVTLIGTASNSPGIRLNAGSTIETDGALTLVGQSDTDTAVVVEGGIFSDGGLLSVTGTANTGATGIVLTEDIFGGGGVSLASNRDIEVSTLIGGENVTVTTPQFFRATGRTDVIELDASVVSQKGQVTITHGGNGETPFIVGNAEVNGTANPIVAAEGTSEIEPTQAFLEDFIQGDIAILTGDFVEPEPPVVEPEPPVVEPDPEPTNDPPNVRGCIADCTTNPQPDLSDTSDPGNLLTVDPQLIPGAEGAILRNENNYTDEYRQYLNLEAAEHPKPDLPQLQFELSLIAEETGEPPAIVYVSFVPSGDEGTAQIKAEQEIQPTDVLELVVVTPDGLPILKTLSVQHEQVFKTVDRFRNNVTNRGRVRTRTYLGAAQELHSWLIEPIEAELAERGITSLAFVMPPGLRSLPVSALHNGSSFLVERYSVGLMPSVSLTDMRYVDIRETEVLAMGASDFEDQPELPAVPIELSTIADQLWAGDFVINETFTPDSLVANRARKPYGIVHLATHGEFKSGSLENSYIQFWDQKLSLDQVRQLGLNNPPVELMVLSACRTALGNVEAELGFAGFAVQAGVKTALASLWKVDDVGTAGLMTQFYTSLQTEPIKAEALRQAQLAMINGDIRVENGQLLWAGGTLELPAALADIDSSLFSHPYFWASFTTIGSPW